jgi:hypothetical protein
MRIRNLLASGALATVAVAALGTAANAAVTINDDGKGDVQTALGLNNAQMQAKAGSLKFTTEQAAHQNLTTFLTQSGTQSGTALAVQGAAQIGTQVLTQESTETLSCFKTNGSAVQQTRTGTKTGERTAERQGTRSGVRFGTREGTREGSRAGTKAGVFSGKLTSDVTYDARVKNQVTGFNLKGYVLGDPKFVGGGITWGDPVFDDEFSGFGAWTPGAYEFTTDYTFGAYGSFGPASFGPIVWDADWSTDGTNEDPDVCLKADGSLGNNIQPGSVVHTITDGPIVEGAVTDGAIFEGGAYSVGGFTPGDVTPGDVSVRYTDYTNGDSTPVTDGPIKVLVNGIAIN